jgi:hypothetical protein
MRKEEREALVLMVVGGAITIGAMLDVYFDIWDILPTFGLIGFCVVFLGKFLLRGIGAIGICLLVFGMSLIKLELYFS